jgi:hypothetical protein
MPVKIVPRATPGKRKKPTFGSSDPKYFGRLSKRKKRKKSTKHGDKLVAKQYGGKVK